MIRNFENGDLKTSGVQFLEGQEETALSVNQRLKLFLGEYFLDVTEGTPWFQGIMGKTPADMAEINLKNRILTAPRVQGFSRFSFETDRDQRQITVQADVIDEDSQNVRVTLNETLF